MRWRVGLGARAGVLAALVNLVWPAVPVDAQWLVEAAAGGVAQDAVTAEVTAPSAILGVRHEGRQWFYLSAGVPLQSEGVPWAAIGAGGRAEEGRSVFRIGADLGGHAHGYRARHLEADGAGLVGEALPFVALDFGSVRLEARSGALHYSSAFDGVTTSRTLHDNGVVASVRPDPRLLASAEGRLVRAPEGDYPYFGGSLELGLPRGGAWAYAGRWTSAVIADPVWGMGATLEVAPRLSIRAGYQQETNDPLFWNDTRRFWSVGVSGRLGGRAPRPAAVPILPERSAGGVVFRIPASASSEPPVVAGDFNQWTPVPMRREGDEWVVVLPIAPGVYQYSFRRPDGSWFVPESVPHRVDDGFGGTNAVLVVPSPSDR